MKAESNSLRFITDKNKLFIFLNSMPPAQCTGGMLFKKMPVGEK